MEQYKSAFYSCRHRFGDNKVRSDLSAIKESNESVIARCKFAVRISHFRSLLPLFQNESKCENEFRLQVHFHVNQTHFRLNDFALRLVLKQRQKGTRKWPVILPRCGSPINQRFVPNCDEFIDVVLHE